MVLSYLTDNQVNPILHKNLNSSSSFFLNLLLVRPVPLILNAPALSDPPCYDGAVGLGYSGGNAAGCLVYLLTLGQSEECKDLPDTH